MNCPACLAKDTIKWTPPVYACRECGHEVTVREYEREIAGAYDRWFGSPPELTIDKSEPR